MAVSAGKLRHRITIQSRIDTQDSVTGENKVTWVDTDWKRIPAAIEPFSAREFISAQSQQSEVSLRIVIRFRSGINSSMRIINNRTGEIYNIHGDLTDKDSNMEHLTIPCSRGVNEG